MFHDARLVRLEWNIVIKTLTLELQEERKAEIVAATFVGCKGFHLDEAIEGCIVLDLEEISVSRYLKDDQNYINQWKQGVFGAHVQNLESSGLRVWLLESSYGLDGYFFANDLVILRNPPIAQ